MDRAGELLADLTERHRDGCDRVGRHSRRFSIGGARVDVHFAGSALVPSLSTALSHLGRSVQDGPADLEVLAIDRESTGVDAPAAPFSVDDVGPAGFVDGMQSERHRVVYQIEPGLLSIVDLEGGRAVLWSRRAADISSRERAAPFRRLLQEWFRPRGIHFVHGAALAAGDGGVLLAGRSGSGKSTTSLSGLSAGLDFLGDDYCLVEPGSEPVAHSLYCTAKSHRADLHRVAAVAAAETNPDEHGEKAMFFLGDSFASQMRATAPIDAVMLPSIAPDGATSVRPARTMAALVELAPTSMLLSPAEAEATLRTLASLLRDVPVVHLQLGTDPAEIVRAIVGQMRNQPTRTGRDRSDGRMT